MQQIILRDEKGAWINKAPELFRQKSEWRVRKKYVIRELKLYF